MKAGVNIISDVIASLGGNTFPENTMSDYAKKCTLVLGLRGVRYWAFSVGLGVIGWVLDCRHRGIEGLGSDALGRSWVTGDRWWRECLDYIEDVTLLRFGWSLHMFLGKASLWTVHEKNYPSKGSEEKFYFEGFRGETFFRGPGEMFLILGETYLFTSEEPVTCQG